jgi:hypothetical protein
LNEILGNKRKEGNGEKKIKKNGNMEKKEIKK